MTLLVSGCTLPGSPDEPRPEPDSEGRQDTADYPEGPYVREGRIGSNLFRTRISVHHVERWEDRSVLRFTVTPLNDQEEDREDLILPAPFGTGALDRQHSAFSLVDPLGQAFYRPVRDESGETTIGSEVVPHWVMDADYEYQVHFPPLPEDTERITLVVNGSFGEFTGIPVIDGGPPAEPPGDSIDPSDISPGDTVAVPLREAEMTSEPEDYARDLYSIIEDSSRTRTSTTDEETIGLHADVLFDFDEATLTPEAEDVLAEVVQETRENADPSRPPIRVVGHTDGRGGDDYNQDLSERAPRPSWRSSKRVWAPSTRPKGGAPRNPSSRRAAPTTRRHGRPTAVWRSPTRSGNPVTPGPAPSSRPGRQTARPAPRLPRRPSAPRTAR